MMDEIGSILNDLEKMKGRISALRDMDLREPTLGVQEEVSEEDLYQLNYKATESVFKLFFRDNPPAPVVGLFYELVLKEENLAQIPQTMSTSTLSYGSDLTPGDYQKIDPLKVSALMAPFSNEQRVRIIQALLFGEKTAGQLMEDLSLTTGQLYHHLGELAKSGFLEGTQRNVYRLKHNVQMFAMLILGCLKPEKARRPIELDQPEQQG